MGFCCFTIGTPLYAQEPNSTTTEYDSLLNEYLLFDSLLLDELTSDSTSFFQLLDDLMEERYLKSAFNLRIGYSGQVSNAGRTIGIDQYGFNVGASFYHKSGIFADAAGFWNSDQVPTYSTAIVGIGYMGNFTKNWSFWTSYEHYFFSEITDESGIISPFNNALNASTVYYLKKLSFGLDYSFTFGDETAHRIRFNWGYNYSKTNLWIFDRIGINPNISMLLGNSNVVSWVIDIQRTKSLINKIGLRRFRYLKNNYPDELESVLSSPVDNNEFGIMNYSLFIPVTFTVKKTSLMLNYTLNLPVELPGEELDTSLNNYVSATFMYTF